MTKLHISHGADPDDWFVVKPLEGEITVSAVGTPITHEMAVQSLLAAGRRVYELNLTEADFRQGQTWNYPPEGEQ